MNTEHKQTLDDLAARRWRVALSLTVVMLAVYFSFILLIAFNKPLMATLLFGDRISLGIVLGALVIATAPVLTALYVRWANRVYDPELHALRHSMQPAKSITSRAPEPVLAPSMPLTPVPSAVAIEEAIP